MATVPTVTHARPRVLIVDDSRSVRATLVKHLESLYDAREAGDGLEAWETLLIDPGMSLVITDLSMPRLDGYGLLERMRGSRIARIRMLPVLVVSGAQEESEHARVRNAGATALIGKGATATELLAQLAQLLDPVT